MPEIILTDEQSQALAGVTGPVAVRDTKGNLVGRLEPNITPERIAELKREAASPGPWYTGEQVRARLQDLQAEWDRTGGFDEARLAVLLQQLNVADPGQMRTAGGAG